MLIPGLDITQNVNGDAIRYPYRSDLISSASCAMPASIPGAFFEIFLSFSEL
jgi:hypothetical protein